MNLIVAVDKNWGIGIDNTMPWHIKEDQQFYKSKTLGNVVVMGRKTFLSLPKQKPQKGRENIILTRDESFNVEGAVTINGVKQLLEYVDKNYNTDDVYIIGGQSIYQTFEKYCKKAYVTKIEGEFEVDTFFPNLDNLDHWEVDKINETVTSSKGIKFTIYEYVNKNVK